MSDLKITAELMQTLDASNMFGILTSFPDHIATAIEIGRNAPLFTNTDAPSDFVLLGMGGSAIGGDILRTYTSVTEGADHIRFHINRNYDTPKFICEKQHVIVSSYSGGTEETLNGLEQIRRKTSNILAITAGGELEQRAEKYGIPTVKIPGGMMPRCALAFSFFPLLFQMMRINAFGRNAINTTSNALEELQDLLKLRAEQYSAFSDSNPAISIARKLVGSPVVVYSGCERTDTVSLRWRGQIQENAKQLAFGSVLPEMNHNEINAWSNPADLAKKFAVILMQDKDDNPRNTIRFNALESIIKDSVNEVIKVQGEGRYLLTRMFDLIYLGDWVSYYLSLMNGVDPTPIPVISKLKDILAKA